MSQTHMTPDDLSRTILTAMVTAIGVPLLAATHLILRSAPTVALYFGAVSLSLVILTYALDKADRRFRSAKTLGIREWSYVTGPLVSILFTLSVITSLLFIWTYLGEHVR